MEKLDPNTDGKTLDIVADNIAKLKELFPEIVTEGKVDFETLREVLGDYVENRDEHYSFTWNGKSKARMLTQTPSNGTLRPCPEESVDFDSTRNLFIEGDNLEVLKLLQKSYYGKIKMIYIDPPYNRGKDYIYPDNYRDSITNYFAITGQVDGEGRKLSSNPETSGRYHTDWLSMMYPRLLLARNILSNSGVIFISIDDYEVSNCRKLCDEVFGEENFVATLVWEKGRKNDAKLVSVGHEYMVVYAKLKSFFNDSGIKWREEKPGAKEIQEEYLRLRGMWGEDNTKIEQELKAFYDSLSREHPSKKLTRYSHVDEYGVWRDDNMSWPGGGGPRYDVIHPRTGEPCQVPDGGWRYSTPKKMQEMLESGKVVFRDDHSEPPIRKTYLVIDDKTSGGDYHSENDDFSEEEDLSVQVAGSYFYRSALQASNELTKLFGKKVFNNPKDREVLSRWISYVQCYGEDDIILDFFAGSGTTAHATMALNSKDGGKRRYILVQLPEPLDKKKKEQNVAAKFLEDMGKPLLISEITKERLRRSILSISSETNLHKRDLGFKVFKLDSTNIKPWDADFDDYESSMDKYIINIKPNRSEEDVLYEILLKYGLDLTLPIEERTIADKKVFVVGLGALVLCLANGITLKVAEGIAKLKKELEPEVMRVVFKDNGFSGPKGDVVKSNTIQILRQHGITDVKSL